ncbi:hypothetical protein FHG87_014889 [Trinorchestia longiramus]|nr:hypothetical protein FHG87_014889 [Trinorchestia longiramus]
MATKPCTLRGIAAEKFLDTLSKCYLIKKFGAIIREASGEGKPEPSTNKKDLFEEVAMRDEIGDCAVRSEMSSLMRCLAEKFKSLPKELQILKHYSTMRAEMPSAAGSETIIQLLFSTDAFLLQLTQPSFLMFLSLLRQKYDNIKTLVSHEYSMNGQLLELCLPIFPNLRVIKIRIESVNLPRALEALRTRAPNLEEIVMPHLPLQYLSDDLLSHFLFAGESFKNVEKRFVEGAPIHLSFRKLKHLSLPLELPTLIRIFRMLLFCYEDCRVDWIPHLDGPVNASVFDSALCPAAVVCPSFTLDLCELRFEDLRFPYVEDVCTSWTKLKTLRIVLGHFYVNVDHKLAQKRLTAVLANCKNLTRFELVIVSNNVDRSYEITLNALKECGRDMLDLKLVDPYHSLSHEDIINLLNCNPNLQKLHLKCKPKTRYCKEAKLVPLMKLTYFRFSFMNEHTSVRGKVSSQIMGDILKTCPNITRLTLPGEELFIAMLYKLKISPKVHTMNFIFYSPIYEYKPIERIVKLLRRTEVRETSLYRNYRDSILYEHKNVTRDYVYSQSIFYSQCRKYEIDARYFTEDFCVQL